MKLPHTVRRLSLLLVLSATVLGGCSFGRQRSPTPPPSAKEERQKNTGYLALQSVSPNTAKVVMRSTGAGHAVAFASSTADQPCEGMKPQGTVQDPDRGVAYPWSAKSRSRGFIEQELKAIPDSLQVQGHAGAGVCGPLTARFRPRADHAYLVNFLFEGTECRLQVSDATDPDAPVSVFFEKIPDCKRG